MAAFLTDHLPDGFERSIMLACTTRGYTATAAEFIDLLQRKWRNPKCQPGGKWAPKSLELVFFID